MVIVRVAPVLSELVFPTVVLDCHITIRGAGVVGQQLLYLKCTRALSGEPEQQCALQTTTWLEEGNPKPEAPNKATADSSVVRVATHEVMCERFDVLYYGRKPRKAFCVVETFSLPTLPNQLKFWKQNQRQTVQAHLDPFWLVGIFQ